MCIFDRVLDENEAHVDINITFDHYARRNEPKRTAIKYVIVPFSGTWNYYVFRTVIKAWPHTRPQTYVRYPASTELRIAINIVHLFYAAPHKIRRLLLRITWLGRFYCARARERLFLSLFFFLFLARAYAGTNNSSLCARTATPSLCFGNRGESRERENFILGYALEIRGRPSASYDFKKRHGDISSVWSGSRTQGWLIDSPILRNSFLRYISAGDHTHDTRTHTDKKCLIFLTIRAQ